MRAWIAAPLSDAASAAGALDGRAAPPKAAPKASMERRDGEAAFSGQPRAAAERTLFGILIAPVSYEKNDLNRMLLTIIKST
jgi:hypothetical protein